MHKYIIQRLLQLIPVLIGITFLSFAMMRIAGSDAITELYGDKGAVSQEIIDAKRAELGLDKPFLTQYVTWLGRMLRGDMGTSYVSGLDVWATFASKLPATLLLTVLSILATVVISIPLGILAAVCRGRAVDYILRFISFIGNSLPNFFVALLLMHLLSIRLKLLPVLSNGISLRSALMPTMTLAIAMSSKYMRQVRAAVLEELQKDYVTGAKARGVRSRVTLWNSVIRSSMLTIITLLALSIGSLLGGTAIIESIFMWDGVGKMAVTYTKNFKGIGARKGMKGARAGSVRARLVFFGVLAALLLLGSVFSEALAPYDPNLQDLANAKAAPSAAHLLGTDRYGRDMLSRVIAGSRASIFSTLLLVAVITAVGTLVGVFCGWHGKRADTVLMRISDIFLAFPGLVFAMAVAGVLGGGLQNAIIALAAISWPKYARIARSQTLAQRETAYLKASKLAGSSTFRIIFVHLLPNIIGPILVTSMLDIGTMMMELAGLSFLGLGAKPPTAEWGSMMSDARSLMTTAPWVAFSPGAAIFLSVMVFNLLGDTIRDYADPRSRDL